MPTFDWHNGEITWVALITPSYRHTPKVRRFFKAECGDSPKSDRLIMAWLKNGVVKTMGDAADEWLRRETAKRQASPR
jgi:hypothetical protein